MRFGERSCGKQERKVATTIDRPTSTFRLIHPLLLRLDGRPIGTTRLDVFGNGTDAVRPMAISTDVQGSGHGRALLALVEDYARYLEITLLFVNAVPEATGYYNKLGWELHDWNGAELIGIASSCKQMRKAI